MYKWHYDRLLQIIFTIFFMIVLIDFVSLLKSISFEVERFIVQKFILTDVNFILKYQKIGFNIFWLKYLLIYTKKVKLTIKTPGVIMIPQDTT